MESTFNTFAAGNFTDDKVAVQTTVATGNNHAFVGLQTATCTLYDAYGYNYGVAWCKFGDVFVQTGNFFLLQLLDQVHCFS